MSLLRQMVQGAVGVGILKLLSLPLALCVSIILARGLGPEIYGRYAFVLAVVSFLALPVGVGLGQLVTREVAKYNHDNSWRLFSGLLVRSKQWVLATSTLLVFVVLVVSLWCSDWQTDGRFTLLSLAVLALPFLGFSALFSGVLSGLHHVFYAQLPDSFVRPVIHLMLLSFLVWVGFLNAVTALTVLIVSIAVSCFVAAKLLRRHLPESLNNTVPLYQDPEWGRAMMPFAMVAMVSVLNSEIGILALGFWGMDVDVAALRLAQSGAMLVVLSLGVVNIVISPYVAHAYQKGDLSLVKKIARKSSRAALLISIPVAISLIFFGDNIVHAVFGAVYVEHVTLPLAILAFGQLVNVMFGSVGQILSMCEFAHETLTGQVVALLVNLMACLLLIPMYGVVGAATAIVLGLVVWNVVLSFMFMKRLGFRPSVL